MFIRIDRLLKCAALGILPLTFLPTLATPRQLISLTAIGITLLIYRKSRAIHLACVLAGFIWANLAAYCVLMPVNYIHHGKKLLQIEGSIQSVDLNRVDEHENIIFLIEKIAEKPLQMPFLVVLHWDSQHHRYSAGQRWALTVKLRAIHSQLNPASFDIQRFNLGRHIVLQGIVKHYVLLNKQSALRQKMVDKTLALLPEKQGQSIAIALAYGERGLMSKAQQQRFIGAGILHLLAISGLHIALAAICGQQIARLLQLCLPQMASKPTFPLWFALVACWGYVWLSGTNPPALRAGEMFTGYIFYRLRGCAYTPWDIFLNVIAIMVVADPLILLSDSFLLSASAVGGLLFWYWLMPLPDPYRHGIGYAPIRLLHLQFGITLCMLPHQIFLFHGISWTSIAINLIAVPFVSFIVMPIILLAIALQLVCSSALFWHLSATLLFFLDSSIAYLPDGWMPLSQYGLAIAAMILITFLAWRMGILRLQMGILWVLSLIIFMLYGQRLLPRDQQGWRVYFFDVGHGLAVLIEKGGKGILYDMGAAWQGGSAAQQAIIPLLRWYGITLDGMIVSHSDNDHRGGLAILKRAYPDAWIRSSAQGELPCIAGQHWQWQEIEFDALWPSHQVTRPYNNDSCVVRVHGQGGSLLLTGDIELAAEKALVKQWHQYISADIIQVPHHGSRTSSSALLLRTVTPKAAIASLSRYSRWGFPAKEALQRYHHMNITWHDTSNAGMVLVNFEQSGWKIFEQRNDLTPRWYHAWFGVPTNQE